MSEAVAVYPEVSHAAVVRQRRRSRRAAANISGNMTPMIDIVFNLLIFFLVGSSFKVAEGLLASKLPSTAGVQVGEQVPLRPIKIRLLRIGDTTEPKDCQIVVENLAKGQPHNFLELCNVLNMLKSGEAYSEDSPVLLLPGADVKVGHVINAYNAVVRARFKSISFASY